MSNDGQEIAPSSPWEITRFEFVYFNRRHKRWQIWQEPPQASAELAASEAANSRPLYRRQFQQLLRIVRDCFQALLTGLDEKSRFVMPSSFGESLQFKIGYDKVLGKDLTFWKGFLSYCSKSLELYGAGSPDLDQLLNDQHLATFSTTELSHKIKRREALDLISILPILRDWDLFGCWHRAWIDDQRLAPDNWGFPPRQAAAGQWIEPFYIARLRYTDQPSSPESPLDNEIPTQVICTDLGAGENGIRLVFPERDFFDPIYCTIPRNENLLLYRSYAYLYDRLQQALTSTTSFIISYPVVCLSRTHFLQIQITRSGQQQASVEDLWHDWMTAVHPLFWSPHVKQFLSEELQRISLSTFQAMWSTSLQKRVGRGDAELRVDDLIETFCDQAYSLVPLRAIRHGGRRWDYQRYNKEDADVEAWSDGGLQKVSASLDTGYGDLGARWKSVVSEIENGSSDEKDGVNIVWDDPQRPAISTISLLLSSRYSTELERTLQEGRARQIAEQQIEFGHQLRASMKEEVRRAQAVQREAQAAVNAHFSDPLNRLDHRQGIAGEVKVPEPVFKVSTMALPVVAGIAWPDQKQLQAEIARLVGVTVPLEASEILEIGAVKALTHQGDDYWCGTLDSTIPYLEKLKAKSVESPEPPGPEVKKWKQTLPTLIDACMESAAQCKRISDRTLYDYLRQEHEEQDWARLFPGWTLEESPTPYKFRPCFPIWESLQHLDIRDAINEYSDGKPAFVGFALPLSPRPMSASEPWAHTSPQLFRNVFRCRYRLKTKGPDVWQRFVDAQIWAVVRGQEPGSGLSRFGALYLGRGDTAKPALFDCTRPPGDPVPVQVEDIFPCEDRAYLSYMKKQFECDPDHVIVALVFDTWRTKK
jgi:hypothetical protein